MAPWDPLLVCVAVYILTAVTRAHQLLPLEVLRPTVVSFALALALYLPDRRPARRLSTAFRMPPVRWAVAFLIWAGLSVPLALRPNSALAIFLPTLPQTVAMSVILVAAVRQWRDVERLGWIYFCGVAAYAVVVLARFQVTDEKWRLAQLYYYDANDYATLVVTALPLGLHFTALPRFRLQRVLTVGGMACMLVAFIWSGSRGGLLALMTVSGYLLFRYKAIHAGWRLTATALMVFMLLVTGSREYWEKMKSLVHVQSDYNIGTPWGRVQLWERGLDYMMTFPFFGVGYQNFPIAEGTIFPLAREMQSHGKGAKWGVAHNSFVQVGSELGVPGLIIYLGLLFSALLVLRSVRGLPHGPRGPPELARAFTASVLGFMVGSFFLTLGYSDMVFTLVAFAAALAKTTRVARRVPGTNLANSARTP